jgi:hypothetical protein
MSSCHARPQELSTIHLQKPGDGWKRRYPNLFRHLIRQVAGNSGEHQIPTDSEFDYRVLYAIVSKDEILVFRIARRETAYD